MSLDLDEAIAHGRQRREARILGGPWRRIRDDHAQLAQLDQARARVAYIHGEVARRMERRRVKRALVAFGTWVAFWSAIAAAVLWGVP